MEQYLGTYLLSTQALFQLQNYLCGNSVDLGLLRSGSVHAFRTVLLSSLVTFATNFDAIFRDDLLFRYLFCSRIF